MKNLSEETWLWWSYKNLSEETWSGKRASGSSTQLTAVGQLQILKSCLSKICYHSVRWQYVIDIVIIDYFWKPTWGWHRRWGLPGSSGGSAVPHRTCNISWHKKFIFFKYMYRLHFVLTSIAAWWYFLWTLSPVHPIRQSQQQLQFQHFGSTHLCHLYLSCTCQH